MTIALAHYEYGTDVRIPSSSKRSIANGTALALQNFGVASLLILIFTL